MNQRQCPAGPPPAASMSSGSQTPSAVDRNSSGQVSSISTKTIAHELCLILHDRTRAQRVAHISGQWVAPGVERRANAFAAYVLMPRGLVVRIFDGQGSEADSITHIAQTLHVNETALIEHLYNLDLIDEVRRERLRIQFRRAERP